MIGPIELATFNAALLSFVVRMPIPINAPAIDIKIGIDAFLRCLSIVAMCARKYASSGVFFSCSWKSRRAIRSHNGSEWSPCFLSTDQSVRQQMTFWPKVLRRQRTRGPDIHLRVLRPASPTVPWSWSWDRQSELRRSSFHKYLISTTTCQFGITPNRLGVLAENGQADAIAYERTAVVLLPMLNSTGVLIFLQIHFDCRFIHGRMIGRDLAERAPASSKLNCLLRQNVR